MSEPYRNSTPLLSIFPAAPRKINLARLQMGLPAIQAVLPLPAATEAAYSSKMRGQFAINLDVNSAGPMACKSSLDSKSPSG
jgi:hypothetical protein